MAYSWTLMDASVGGFLSLVKQKATLAPNTRFTPDVLRAMADSEMRTRVVPALLTAGGEHLGVTRRVAVPAGRASVRLPSRLLRLRSLSLEVGGRTVPLDRVDETSLHGRSATGTPRLYVEEAHGRVRLYPTPDAACTLVARVYQSPGQHVDPAACGIVQSFSAVDREVTLRSAPPAAFAPGAKLDVLAGQPDFGWLACELEVDSVEGNVVTLTSALPDDMADGDFLVTAGETPVPQAPEAWHSVLVMAVAAECLRDKGDGEVLAMVEAQLARAEVAARAAIAPTSHQSVAVFQGDFL